jgi:hypothetical protein
MISDFDADGSSQVYGLYVYLGFYNRISNNYTRINKGTSGASYREGYGINFYSQDITYQE